MNKMFIGKPNRNILKWIITHCKPDSRPAVGGCWKNIDDNSIIYKIYEEGRRTNYKTWYLNGNKNFQAIRYNDNLNQWGIY